MGAVESALIAWEVRRVAVLVSVEDWCAGHLVSYQGVGRGCALALLLVSEALLQDERFQRLCGWDPARGLPAKADQIPGVLAQVAPVCCFLGDAVMEQVRQVVQAGLDDG